MTRFPILIGIIALFCANIGFAQRTFTTHPFKVPHALGLKRTAKSLDFIKKAKRAFIIQDVAIPAALDLSPRVSRPENQLQCGGCWAFGITKALRSASMLVGKDPGRLAFNYLISNCGAGPRQWGCNGGDFDAGQSFLNGGGPWLESLDPYQGYASGCKGGLSVADTGLDYVAVGPGTRPPTFQELASAIADEHMLVIDVAADNVWSQYSSGIYNRNGSQSINHIINMNGYDCETSKDANGKCVFNSQGQPVNGDGFLWVMNNWGETGWGVVNPSNNVDGYMKTRWGMNAIASTAMYFVVAKPPPPPVPVPPTPVPTPHKPLPIWIWIIFGSVGLIAVNGGVTLLIVKNLKK